MSVGAYSQKYQQIERERLSQYQHAKKVSRNRALLLSKQTAQRQRALEEKKQAMATAEEERRRKALEERHKAQQEATERFKSAIVRLRSTSSGRTHSGKGTKESHRGVDMEMYLPTRTRVGSTSSSGGGQRKPSKYPEPQRHGERVAVGRDVEVTSRETSKGLQRRVPSLDEVLRAVRGQDSKGPPRAGSGSGLPPSDRKPSSDKSLLTKSGQSVSDPDLSLPDRQTQTEVPSPVPGRSHPSYTSSGSSSSGTRERHTSTETKEGERPADEGDPDTKSSAVSSAATGSDGVIHYHHAMFQQVHRMHHDPPTSMTNDVRVMSPDEPGSPSSDADSETSGTLRDSLDGSLNHQKKNTEEPDSSATKKPPSVLKSQRVSVDIEPERTQPVSTNFFMRPRDMATTHSSLGKERHFVAVGSALRSRRPKGSKYAEDSDSSSTDEYLPTGRFPPRLRRRARYSGSKSQFSRKQTPQQDQQEPRHLNFRDQRVELENYSEPQIVGILKKAGGSSHSRTSSKVSSASSTTVQPSHPGSTPSSATGLDSSQSRNKKVRFVDQVRSPSTIALDRERESSVTAMLESARLELWNSVQPNGFTSHFPPNNAFTPRMRVSLSSSKTPPPTPPHLSSRKTTPVSTIPPNGITVHIPRASIDSPSQTTPASTKGQIAHNPVSERDPLVCYREMNGTSESEAARKKTPSEPAPSSLSSSPRSTASDSSSSRGSETGPGGEGQVGDRAAGGGHRGKIETNGKHISLDKTPTDDDINELWEQIKTYFNGRDKGSIPAQLSKFLPNGVTVTSVADSSSRNTTNQRESISTSSGESLKHSSHGPQRPPSPLKHSSHSPQRPPSPLKHSSHGPQRPPSPLSHGMGAGQKQLSQRQQTRPMRCRNETHHPMQLWTQTYPHSHTKNTHSQSHSHSRPHTHSSSSSPRQRSQSHGRHTREGEVSLLATGKKVSQTPLSVEEQRVMESIEKLNHRIRDHVSRQGSGDPAPLHSMLGPSHFTTHPPKLHHSHPHMMNDL